MDFVESAIVSDEADSTVGSVGPAFAECLRKNLNDEVLGSRFDSILFFPTILHARFGEFPEYVSYRRSEPVIAIQHRINYDDWVAGTQCDRFWLYAQALMNGIDGVRKSAISDEEKTRLNGIIRSTAEELCTAL